jgi:hypothetical protein
MITMDFLVDRGAAITFYALRHNGTGPLPSVTLYR